MKTVKIVRYLFSKVVIELANPAKEREAAT